MQTFAVHPAQTGLVVHVPLGSSPARRRRHTVLAVAAASLLVLSYCAPRMMGDHTPAPAPAGHGSSSPAAAGEGKPPFNVNAAIEKARHQITPVPGMSGTLAVSDAGYRATFTRAGYTYAPKHATGALSVSLAAIARGTQPVAVHARTWHGAGNVADRAVSSGIREQVTGRDGEIEWDVVLAEPVAGTGPLTVRADLHGVVGQPRQVDRNTGWRVPLGRGASARIGQTVVKDALGAVVYRAMPTVTGTRIALTVPARVLADAAYPLTIDPTISQPVTIATGTLINDPKVASDGSNYLVVWAQVVESFGDWHIYGARVSADGTFVQPVGQISSTTAGKSSVAPDVAWNGSEYLVVWQFNYATNDVDIYSQRVSSTGALLGGIVVVSQPSAVQDNATVTAAGSTFYVAWEDRRSGNADIYGGRIPSTGPRLDGDGVAVVTGSKDESVPDVAWNGTSFLVAYQYAFSSTDHDIHARLVNSSAVPVGTDQVLSGGGAEEENPAVASNGSDYLVAWQDGRNTSTTGTDIYGARVNGFGTVTTGGIPISTAVAGQSEPTIAHNGTYLVGWLDRRNSGRYDVWGARVAGDGTVQDRNGFALAALVDEEFTPDLARGPGNKWALDYEAYDGATSHVTHRTIAPK